MKYILPGRHSLNGCAVDVVADVVVYDVDMEVVEAFACRHQHQLLDFSCR